MSKFFSVLFSLFVLGVAHAADIQDAPIPEPNYVGIIIFLVIMFGGGGWYLWHVMTRSQKDEDQK